MERCNVITFLGRFRPYWFYLSRMLFLGRWKHPGSTRLDLPTYHFRLGSSDRLPRLGEIESSSKNKVFLWQLIRGRVLSCKQWAKRHDPSDGLCSFSRELENCNFILFSCPITLFSTHVRDGMRLVRLWWHFGPQPFAGLIAMEGIRYNV